MTSPSFMAKGGIHDKLLMLSGKQDQMCLGLHYEKNTLFCPSPKYYGQLDQTILQLKFSDWLQFSIKFNPLWTT